MQQAGVKPLTFVEQLNEKNIQLLNEYRSSAECMHQLRLPGARGIPDKLWTAFCEVIQELRPHIEELHISQASLTTAQTMQLFEALSAEDLKTIEIFSANLEDDIVDSLCKLISKSMQLEQLKLSDNKLTHKGLEQIS